MSLLTNDVDLFLPPEKKLYLPPNPKWAPLYYTKAKSELTRGEDVADFARTLMKPPRGVREGLPLELLPWQRWAVDLILEEKEDGHLRHREFLLGVARKNGKSMLGTVLALERLLWGKPGTRIYSAAKDREQAKLVFNYAKATVLASPSLSRLLKCFRDTIENVKTGATYRAISSDAMSAQGLSIEMCIADEPHAWEPNQEYEYYAALSEASADLAESLLVLISTAGKSKDSLLGTLYETGVENSEMNESPDNSLGFIWFGAPDDADVFDEEVWKKASPSLAEGITNLDYVRGKLDSAMKMGKLGGFKRYQLNQWGRSDGQTSWVTQFQWKQAETLGKEIPKGARITVGFDGSLSDDSTAFVGIDIETGLIEVLASWHRDYSDDNWTVPRKEVNDAFERIMTEYDVAKMWVDSSFWQTDVQTWQKKYRQRIENIPQSNTRLTSPTEQMKIDLVSGELFHAGDKKLREHFMNAVLSDNGRIYKEKRGSRNKIDLAMCAIMANGARNKVLGKNQKKSSGARMPR